MLPGHPARFVHLVVVAASLAVALVPVVLLAAEVPPPSVPQRFIDQAASPTSTARSAATTRPTVAATAKAAPALTTGGYTGSAPARGSIGLLVANQRSGPDGLVVALSTAGCAVEALAVLEAGTWRVYVPHAPAAIKARLGFPSEIGPTRAFFVRCAV